MNERKKDIPGLEGWRHEVTWSARMVLDLKIHTQSGPLRGKEHIRKGCSVYHPTFSCFLLFFFRLPQVYLST